MTRVGYLDGWRGAAILSVLFGHFVTSQGLNLGRFGVELFFVLSGRLMAEILFVRQTPLTTFFPRRLARIYPALFVFALAMFVVGLTTPFNGPSLLNFLAAITLTSNYVGLWTKTAGVTQHIWSLCVEEHVYILLGLVAFVRRRVAFPVAGVCAGLAVLGMLNGAIQTLNGLSYYHVYWRSDVRGASILISVAVYLALRRQVPAWLSWKGAPVVLGLAALALQVDGSPDPLKYSLGTTLLAASLALMPAAPGAVLKAFENPVMIRAGIYSYSLYLWQQPFYTAAHGLLEHLLLLPAAAVAALLSFYLVEQPARTAINDLVGRTLRPRRRPEPARAAA
ncbi:acyltransferase [Phenylobacterium sp. LjRoot225]|uniref:acyltransferase family protein n=1 Tax=Phenylobacterium sp. LjRoot225 TaxID=3342285 RepID=UPI003ECD84A1